MIMLESLQTMEERIAALESTGKQVNDQTIDKINKDTVTYAANLQRLKDDGYELGPDEIRNYDAVIYSKNLPTSEDVLKNYGISLIRSNGRYELNPLVKGNKLATDLDTLIEAGLEDLITSDPRALALNADEVVKRTKYLESHGEKIQEDDEFNKEIIDYGKFYEKYGYQVSTEPLEEVANNRISGISDNSEYINILLELLDTHYTQDENLYRAINLDEEGKSKVEDILRSITTSIKAEDNTKQTYSLNGTLVSKNKVERNVSLLVSELLSKGENLDGVEQEILLVSSLYNLHISDEELSKIRDNCLGFNEEKKLGGLAA